MAHPQRDGDDFLAEEDIDFIDFDDVVYSFYDNEGDDSSDTEAEEYDLANRLSDTTAAQARAGKDIQGILWDRLQFTREKYRETRLRQYKNYENLNRPHDVIDKECLKVEKGGKYYAFQLNTRSVKSTVVHFQLRNLVWATSKHDIYLMFSPSVLHWSPLTRKITEVLNVSEPIMPPAEVQRRWAVQQGLGRIQISTMCVKDNLLVAGGFQGEIICKFLDCHGVAYRAKISYDDNAITNAIEIYKDSSGTTYLLASNNDNVVRVFETQRFGIVGCFYFPWAVNHTSISPDNKLLVVVGDNADGFVADSQTGKVLTTLKGHLDYSFATAWHPDGRIFATGNQDSTCRLWDIRNLSSSLAVLKGRMGAIRSLRFTSDGRFLAMAEPADFVHIFDVKQDFTRCQEIDLFGEIAGISFSPDTTALFIGIADRTYGSLLEYNRCHNKRYLDSYI